MGEKGEAGGSTALVAYVIHYKGAQVAKHRLNIILGNFRPQASHRFFMKLVYSAELLLDQTVIDALASQLRDHFIHRGRDSSTLWSEHKRRNASSNASPAIMAAL